ncbi:hypothetical protein ABIE38_002331 [Dietzia sp. 2505]
MNAEGRYQLAPMQARMIAWIVESATHDAVLRWDCRCADFSRACFGEVQLPTGIGQTLGVATVPVIDRAAASV